MKKLLITVGAIFILSGCAIMKEKQRELYQNISSGKTGCAPSQIEITNIKRDRMVTNTDTWTATCNDKIYRCSVTSQEAMCTPASSSSKENGSA